MKHAAARFLGFVCLLLIIPSLVAQPFNRGTPAPDSRVQVVSPSNGQQFSPGDTVDVTVKLTPPLHANAGWLAVGAPGLGILQGTHYNGSSYQVSFVIPESYAGSLLLTPDIIDSSGNPVEGVGVTITVKPKSAPTRLSLESGQYNHLLSASEDAHIYVSGKDSNGVDRNLTTSVTGTTYTSSNDQVLSVDKEGNVQVHGFGTAVVTVENSGQKAFAAYDVEDPNNPLSPQDLTDEVSITRSDFQMDPRTGFSVQTIQITNSQAVPLIGPFYVVVTDIASGVNLLNVGKTTTMLPVGSPYRTLRTADGVTLQPGEHMSLTLQFLDMGHVPINYALRVFRTLTRP